MTRGSRFLPTKFAVSLAVIVDREVPAGRPLKLEVNNKGSARGA